MQNMNEITLQKQQAVADIKSKISLDYGTIAKYGNGISSKLTDFSSAILESVKVKDNPEVENLLLTLIGELNTIDCTTLQTRKRSLFQKITGKNDPSEFIAKYESVHSFIQGVIDKLQKAEFQLGKDVGICEDYIEQNRQYIEELDIFIEAGQEYIKEAREDYEKVKAEANPDDMLAAQELAMYDSQIRQFENKVHNLTVQRMVAIQNIPQLMLIKDGDVALVEKINASINTSIPMWESQMVIAVQILRQQNGAKLAKSVTDVNNELLKRNAELLKQSTTAVAMELERDIVDISTLQQTNAKLIETVKEIRQIRDNGQKERKAVAEELSNLQHQLIEAMSTEDTGTPLVTSKLRPLNNALPYRRNH